MSVAIGTGANFLRQYRRMDSAGEKADGTARAEARAAVALARRIAAGDRAAEQALVERYSRGLLFMLRRRCNEAELADDLHQDTFRIVLERLRSDSIKDPSRLAGFIHNTARNLYIGVMRRRSRRNTYADSDAIDATAGTTANQMDESIQEQRAQQVRALLDGLSSDRDRALLIRFYLHQEDKQSICDALDLSAIHFNRVLYRAKQRMRELVERSEDQATRELADN